jgi:hypothetical protein
MSFIFINPEGFLCSLGTIYFVCLHSRTKMCCVPRTRISLYEGRLLRVHLALSFILLEWRLKYDQDGASEFALRTLKLGPDVRSGITFIIKSHFMMTFILVLFTLMIVPSAKLIWLTLQHLWFVQPRACAQLDNITHGTTTTSAHRPPTFTVYDKQHKIFYFQVNHADMRSSLKMAHGCRNM